MDTNQALRTRVHKPFFEVRIFVSHPQLSMFHGVVGVPPVTPNLGGENVTRLG